jgi:hypothetical protein
MDQDLDKRMPEVDRLRPAQEKIELRAADLPQHANPWLAGAGMFRDDPLFDEWQRAIAEYRRELDSIADGP